MTYIKNSNFRIGLLYTITILLAIFLSTYFRILWIENFKLRPSVTDRAMAAMAVYNSIKQQIETGIAVTMPNLSGQERTKLVEQRVQEAIKLEPQKFQEAVSSIAKNASRKLSSESDKSYLLEADPYYYYYAVQTLQEQGALSSQFKDGLFFNPLRLAPTGSWDWVTLHPYLGYYCHRLFKLLNPQQDLTVSLSWVPVILVGLTIPFFFQLCSTMRLGLLPSFLGCVTWLLSPIFLQRSAFGWFDTDPYNHLFPILTLLTFFTFLRENKRPVVNGCVGGFLTGVYGLFWTGWPFLFVLMLASIFSVGTIEYVRSGKNISRPILYYLFAYLISAIFFLFILITPQVFVRVIYNGLIFLPKFSVSQFEKWPSVFLTVGEAKSISIQKLIFLTGNYNTAALSLFGLSLGGIYFWKQKMHDQFYQWLTLLVIVVPLAVMSLKTERFTVLLVVPMSLLIALGVKLVQNIFEKGLSKIPTGNLGRILIKLAGAIVIILGILPTTVIEAGMVSSRISPIMDLVWYQALTEIRQKTPAESIIYSWWPPGYFIISIAHRKSLVDGGTQERPQSYWLAKAFLSSDEREATGILRMLGLSGNDAMDFIQTKGFDLADSVDLIMKIVSLPRQKALWVIPPSFTIEEKNKLLDLTHGKQPVPGYVLLYQDLIDQNVALSLMSEWDFKKAKEIADAGHPKRKVLGFDYFNHTQYYIDDMLKTTGGVLKYWPESRLLRQDGDVLRFDRGISMNQKTKEVSISIPEKGIEGSPVSLLYFENGNLIEKEFLGNRIDVSVLLIDRGGIFSCVVADRKLIRSMMFRWFYLDGAGLALFRPFIIKEDNLIRNKVSVFAIDWKPILEEDHGGES